MSRSTKKNWELRTLLSIVGFVLDLVRSFVRELEAQGGTIGHLRRLISEPDLLKRVVALIVAEPGMAWKTWKTIHYRAGEIVANSYLPALEARHCSLTAWSKALFDQLRFGSYAFNTAVELAIVTVEELGIIGWATYQEVCDRGVSMGLGLCSPEDGPEARLAYPTQPRNEILLMAMDSFEEDGLLQHFVICEDTNQLFLSANGAPKDAKYPPSQRFIFRRK